MAILSTIPPFLDIAPFRYNSDLGACTPLYSGTDSLWYTIAFSVCTLFIPGFLIILCNIKVSQTDFFFNFNEVSDQIDVKN